MAAPSGDRKKKPKPVGPATLTPARRKKLLDTIRLGVNKDDAAKLVGVPHSTFFDWLDKAKQPDMDPCYSKFADEIEVALIEVEQRRLGIIDAAANGEWQAAAWLLERKFPDRYGRRTRVESNVTITAQPMIDASKLTLEEQETLIGLLRKASPAQEELQEHQRPALELLPAVVEAEA